MSNSDKTPILLHPNKREMFFSRGLDLFNDEMFFEAREAWEDLLNLEEGRNKTFLQGLIYAADHFEHIQRRNWTGAFSPGEAAREKLKTPPKDATYTRLDIVPIISGLEYNLELLIKKESGREAYLFPKLLD